VTFRIGGIVRNRIRAAGRLWLGSAVVAALAVGTPATAVIDEVDLDDFGTPVSIATLAVDNPGTGAFTTYDEAGVTVTPLAGDFGFFADGNGGLGLRFAQTAGFGDGTAVLTFDDPQLFLGVEVGFGQDNIRVALFADAAGTQPLGTLILGDGEPTVGTAELFALRSSDAFRRAEIEDVDEMGVIQDSNMISDLRFAAVPEPARAVLLALAAAALTWLPRRPRR
jgi:hypothetical protein